MRPKNEVGFTIIETMLFLGITALLAMGVIIGTGTSINIQRYRDSVTSLQSNLRQQYSDVSNTTNERDNDWSCNDSGEVVTGDTARGQSDCVILGRFITTTNDSKSLLIRNVVGYTSQNVTAAQSDIDALKQYNIQISPISSITYNLLWGASVAEAKTKAPLNFSMLILRSPSSGTIRTFVNPSMVVSDGDISSLISNAALNLSAKLCVNSNGLFNGGSAVIISPNATGASGIKTMGDDSGC